MITNDEIEKLAREYAEDSVDKYLPDTPLVPNARIRIVEAVKANTERLIRFLLRTHCIVSKEKVNDEYETSKHYFKATDSSNPTQKQYFYGRMTVFESLFGAETFKNGEI